MYLTLAKDKSFENNQYQLYNVTFASPMFGNMALKYWYEENCAEFGKNMFHFVCDDDVVPASLYANYAFNQLSLAFKIAIKVFSESIFNLHYLPEVQANPPKNCTKNTILFLASMGETGLSHDIFFKFSLRPFEVFEVR